jgi:hypothetical protein
LSDELGALHEEEMKLNAQREALEEQEGMTIDFGLIVYLSHSRQTTSEWQLAHCFNPAFSSFKLQPASTATRWKSIDERRLRVTSWWESYVI